MTKVHVLLCPAGRMLALGSLLVMPAHLACGTSSGLPDGNNDNGQGQQDAAGETQGPFADTARGQDGGGYCGSSLTGTLRDFKAGHPDFEHVVATDRGIAQSQLGLDGKPVYAKGAGSVTTTGQANFDQWFRDVPGVNIAAPFTIQLTKLTGNTYTFEDGEFFPLDGQGFGNEGNLHNFHFTYELHTRFVYLGGETFKFTGDDDLFTFINGKLAIDLGGVHSEQTQTVDLDKSTGDLGLQKGQEYSLDVFFTERHTSESHFRIDTTIASFVNCGVGPK